MQSSLASFFTGVRCPPQPSSPVVPKKMKSKSTKNAVVGSGKLMDMWGVGKPSKENNKEEEKQLKEGKEEEVKAKKSRRVTLTPGGEGGGKRVKKEKKVKEDEQVDEECAKAQAQAQADAAAAKAEKEKKEKRELAVKEEKVKEERDEEDVEDEDAEDEVEDEAEHEKEEHEEDEKILTLIKSYPPNLTFTTLATKLMRQSVPMYACGHYWSHYKTLHSLTSKSSDPTPAELAMAKIEKLKAQNKETLGEFGNAVMERAGDNVSRTRFHLHKCLRFAPRWGRIIIFCHFIANSSRLRILPKNFLLRTSSPRPHSPQLSLPEIDRFRFFNYPQKIIFKSN